MRRGAGLLDRGGRSGTDTAKLLLDNNVELKGEIQAEEERSDEVNHNWFILYSTAHYVMSFSDVTDDSYFILNWQNFL